MNRVLILPYIRPPDILLIYKLDADNPVWPDTGTDYQVWPDTDYPVWPDNKYKVWPDTDYSVWVDTDYPVWPDTG